MSTFPGDAKKVRAAGAAAMRKDDQPGGQAEARQEPYVHISQAFAAWFNSKLRLLPNTQIKLGLKTAMAVRLHPDGQLECSLVATAGEGEKTFVPFERQYLDQLVRKIAAIGL